MSSKSDAPVGGAEPGFPHRFQKLKAEAHRQMVESIDLSKLGTWKPDRLRREEWTGTRQWLTSPGALQQATLIRR